MVMWISKNLDGGFRIGTTIRTTPTREELSHLKKVQFISVVKERLANAFLSYLMQNGYYVTQMKHLKGVDIDDGIFNPVSKFIKNFKETMQLLEDGGNLTEKRKEVLLKSIYGIEELLSSKNELKELHFKREQLQPLSWKIAFFISFLLLFSVSKFNMPEHIGILIWFFLSIVIFSFVKYRRMKCFEKKDIIFEEIKKKARIVVYPQ